MKIIAKILVSGCLVMAYIIACIIWISKGWTEYSSTDDYILINKYLKLTYKECLLDEMMIDNRVYENGHPKIDVFLDSQYQEALSLYNEVENLGTYHSALKDSLLKVHNSYIAMRDFRLAQFKPNDSPNPIQHYRKTFSDFQKGHRRFAIFGDEERENLFNTP